MSSKTDIEHPLFARFYIRLSKNRGPEEEHRRALLKGCEGEVLEVGAGTGLNFPHYPSAVTRVLAVEPEPTLREEARNAAAEASVPIEVSSGTASALPAEDGSFDVAVASLVLCSVPDQAEALAEMHRVLKPGGELRFYEHVVTRRPGRARLMRFADATLWPRVGGGCHMSRDTQPAIEAAGFKIESVDRFPFSPGVPVPRLPHILGLARRA